MVTTPVPAPPGLPPPQTAEPAASSAAPQATPLDTSYVYEFTVKTGDSLPTFDLAYPRPGPEAIKASELASTPFAPDFKYRPKVPAEGTKRAKQVLDSAFQSERYRAYIAAGLTHATSVEFAGVKPQARALFPIADRHTPCIASGSQANVEAAIKMRHFPGKTTVTADSTSQKHLLDFAAWIGQRLSQDCAMKMKDIDLNTLVSKRWNKNRASQAVGHASQGDFKGLHNFFVKLNEAQVHGKCKPRGICASSDPLQALHCIDAALLEHTLFSNPVFESRSIKHGNQDVVNERIGNLMQRCAKGGGKCLSVDFSSWDSTLQNGLRDLVENTIVAEFLKGIDDGASKLLGQCFADRLKKTLKSTAGIATFVAEVFGRQSGDRGTSILNYLTNLCLAYGLAVSLGTTESPKQWYDSLQCKNAKVDFAAEGDDLTLFFAAGLVMDPSALLRSFFSHYESLGLKPEPAVTGGGVSRDPMECLLCPLQRLEFVSRIFFFSGGRCVSIPKLTKTLPGLPITFSREELLSVGFTTALSGQNNASAHPLLREFYHTLQHAYHGGTFKATDWKSTKLEWWAYDADVTVNSFVTQRTTNREPDGDARKRIASEHPRLTVATQVRLEDILQGCRAYDRETTLQKLGEVYADIADLLRA